MIELVRTDAEQPWHVRLVADNHEPVSWTENLAEKSSAVENLEWFGRLFSPCDKATYDPKTRLLHVWLNATDEKGGLFLPVREVDERTETRGEH